MKLLFNLSFLDDDNNVKNINTNLNIYSKSSSKLNKKGKFFQSNYMKFKLIIISIPLISFCFLYAWKQYKKSRKILDDYTNFLIKKLNEKIKLIYEKFELEKNINSNNNLGIESNLYKFFDLDICLEIIFLKNEIENKILFINDYDLIVSKNNSAQTEIFEEYFCYFNEIKKKKRLNKLHSISIIEEKLNISYVEIEKKILEEKNLCLIDLNDILLKKDFYTKENHENSKKIKFSKFLNYKTIFSYFNVFNLYNFLTKKHNFLQNSELNENKNINQKNSEKFYKNSQNHNDFLDITIDDLENKYSIPDDQIGLYISAFICYSSKIVEKLEEILSQNNVDICDNISIGKDLKNYSRAIFSYAHDIVKEKYRINSKNLLYVISQNNCFKNKKVLYYYDELKSYSIRFEICLLEV